MTAMTIPQRISDFLSQRQERMYCDTCIQERLGLKWRQQVQLITATLAVTATFRREFNKCCTCEIVKQVTNASQVTHARHGRSQAAATKQKLDAKDSPRRKSLNVRLGVGRPQAADHSVNTLSQILAHNRETN
jgi:hypothetical protein